MKGMLSVRNIAYILVVIFSVLVLFRPPDDPDFGWHFKYGEGIYQSHSIQKDNTFSYTFSDYKWANSYWLAEVIIYILYHTLGNTLPSIILSALLGISLIYILEKRGSNTFGTAITTILATSTLSIFSLSVRPIYFSSYYFLALIYLLLFDNKRLWLLPIIFVLWANTHADFVIGLFILGIYSFDNLVSAIKSKIHTSYNLRLARIFWKSFNLFLISTLCTLINPYGTGLWTTLLGEVTQPIRGNAVMEWRPLYSETHTVFFVGIILAIGLLSSILLFKNKLSKYSRWYLALTIFFYILSIISTYFIRIFVLFTALSVKDTLHEISSNVGEFIKRKKIVIPKSSILVFLSVLIFSVFPNFLNNVYLSLNMMKWTHNKSYPYKAVEYIKENPIQGNMRNRYNWGGYLIWQLPEYKTFIDGRMASWKQSGSFFLDDYTKVSYKTKDNMDIFNKYIKEYDIKWIIESPSEEIVKYLKAEEADRWEVVYEDDISVIMAIKE